MIPMTRTTEEDPPDNCGDAEVTPPMFPKLSQ